MQSNKTFFFKLEIHQVQPVLFNVQALNACETDAAFELADPEEELELKLAGVKALNETVCSELWCGWHVQFE